MKGDTDVEHDALPHADVYEDLRPLLFSIAYGITGSVAEAEDIVQEAFMRFHREQQGGTEIESPKGWLSTVTSRLAINHLRSARVRRESYVGTWLPEPVLTDPSPDASQYAEMADALSMAFLVLLERLSPVERAVFLLREAFDYGYDEIAEVVGKSAENCRQIARRARLKVESDEPRFEVSREQRDELARRFFDAADHGDADGLIELLAADAVLYADGGGKTRAFTRPVHGGKKIAEVFQDFRTWVRMLGATRKRPATVNGQPGAVFQGPDGGAVLVVSFDIADGQVQAIRAITNPDKLRHLSPPT